MDAASREQFRIALLNVLEANQTKFGLNILALRLHARRFGCEVMPSDVLIELRYLQDKKLVETMPKEISPEIEAWRITAAGRDFLAQQEV